ncbi:unnamed protein product [Sphagnum compactum]
MIFEVFNISPAAGFSSIAATPLGRSTKLGSSSEQQDFCGSLDHLVPSPIIAAASESSSEFKDSENHSKSRTSRRSRGSHPKRTPEITFLFLVQGPLLFAPLWQRYFRDHEDKFSIYVHAAPFYIPIDIPGFSPFYGLFICSKEVKWGQISMTDAERRLLRNSLLDYTNDMDSYDKFAASMSSKHNCASYIDEHYISTVAAWWLPDKSLVHTCTSDADHGSKLEPSHTIVNICLLLVCEEIQS